MRKSEQGFTLIEMMVVVVLLAITVGVTSDILISLVRSNTRTQVINEIEQQANFISLKIEKELRDARYVNLPEIGTSGNTLEFTKRDGSSVSYFYDSTNGILNRVIGTHDPDTNPWVPLVSTSSPGGVKITCSGNCFSVVGNPQVVQINMDFAQAENSQNTEGVYTGVAKIESSIVIRSTY